MDVRCVRCDGGLSASERLRAVGSTGPSASEFLDQRPAVGIDRDEVLQHPTLFLERMRESPVLDVFSRLSSSTVEAISPI